jgi:hypothetical protein
MIEVYNSVVLLSNDQLLDIMQQLTEKLANQPAEFIKALDERELKKESNTIVISEATQARVIRLLEGISVGIIDDEFEGSTQSISFSPFNWNGLSEIQGTPYARDHLEKELKKFGAKFGRGNYKLVDCHSLRDLLSFDDNKIGKISGGSDLIIVPFKTAQEGYRQQISVVFELKTDENVRISGGLQSFFPQGLCQLLAARVSSYQPKILVVVTDLASEAAVFQLTYDKTHGSFNVIKTLCTLSEMATFVTEFLSTNAVPDAYHRPLESNPNDEEVITFKKTKVSNDHGLVMEHFKEIIEDPESTMEERHHFLRQLLMSSDIEKMPAMLDLSWQSMYA